MLKNKWMSMIGAIIVFCMVGAMVRAEDAPARPGLAADAKLDGRKKIVFISGPPSHGWAAHEHYAGCMLLAKDLNENVPQVYAEVYKWKWPEDPKALEDAAAIIIYSDGGGGHPAMAHLEELGKLMDKGIGLGCIHYAVEIPKGPPGDDLKNWIGGYFETFFSVNPEWRADYKDIPRHAVTNGVHPFSTQDEWYYHMRFRDDMKGVTPILSAIPPDSTRQGHNDAHGGNEFVHAGIGKNIPETTVWVAERDHDGRGFGCTGGHHHWNWAQDDFRKTILNSIVWIAHVEVPADGVPSKTPTVDDLVANQDEPAPANFNKEEEQKQLTAMNAKDAAR